MRESEHFNLNLVEGSDIVNPLVTDVPNYESIDAQLFKNQNAGVQNATELKSGTVHAITRLVPDAQMITFTATSNFVAGDTFTVDGIQVSALTVSGEQLPTGAYVINSQVLAILKGTLLTVYGVGSETADNALKLNGHPDTYFGTKESVDNAIATANAANELVNELNNSLDELKRKVLIGSASASSNSYATVRGINEKVAGYKMLYLQATINTNFFSLYVPVDALSSGFNPIFRTGAENCNVQFTYVHGVSGGQIQLNEFTVDGVEYNTHTNTSLTIYAMY